MNEKRIQEVIEIEKRAQQLLATASRAAEDLPAKAEIEAREIIEQPELRKARARSCWNDPARKTSGEIIEVAGQDGEDDRLAEKNMEKAVTYVLQQVIGGS
jgi:hypothetical protein